MLPINNSDILKHLVSKGIQAQIQKETNQICIMLKIGEREFPLFIRIFDGGELLQLLAFLPCNFNTDALGEVARLLHALNKKIDLPGFCMDEDSQTIFYRCMLPVRNKKIDSAIFDALLNAVQVVCTSFAPVIATVAYGTVTFKDVIKQSKLG